MSRGGRGGFAGGRGDFPGGRRDIPFEIDPNLKPDFAPSELFPPNPPPTQNALSREERICITRFREFRDKARNGPFYTVMARKLLRGLENPFEETEKYSRRYKKRRMVPKLDARPYGKYQFYSPSFVEYLKRYIPGRPELAKIMKEAVVFEAAVVKQVLKEKPAKCVPKEKQVRRKVGWKWGVEQQNAFDAVKTAIVDNATTGGDINKQYHLSCDASQRGLELCYYSPPGNNRAICKSPCLCHNV